MIWLVAPTSAAWNSQPHQHSPNPRPALCDPVPQKARGMRLGRGPAAEAMRAFFLKNDWLIRRRNTATANPLCWASFLACIQKSEQRTQKQRLAERDPVR